MFSRFGKSLTVPDHQCTLEHILHDIGAISMISCGTNCSQYESENSLSYLGQSVYQTAPFDNIRSLWQIAHRMKSIRGRLKEETTKRGDNFRVIRYLSKFTKNVATALGCDHLVGSLQKSRLADLVIWEPSQFMVSPKYVLKGGQVSASTDTSGIGKCPFNLSLTLSADGLCGPTGSLALVSKAAIEVGCLNLYGLRKHAARISAKRLKTNRHSMNLNNCTPKVTVCDAENKIDVRFNGDDAEVFAINNLVKCITSVDYNSNFEMAPLGQRYRLL
ncbi:hypothetical protein ACOME3_010240 [Neoechinorhynchus agilis]